MSKVRCGVIGLGLMGASGHVYQLSQTIPDAEVVAICDNDPEHLESATQYVGPECKLYLDADELIEDPDVEAVVISTPNHLHRPQAEKAFACGKHVFTEKPMAPTVQDCLAMIEASEKAGKILEVGLLCRYNPQFHKFAEIIDHAWVTVDYENGVKGLPGALLLRAVGRGSRVVGYRR